MSRRAKFLPFSGSDYRLIEAQLLRGERPANYEECLALIAYGLGNQRFDIGQPHRALPLLELSNAFAQEFGFCQYWHHWQHAHMRTLLVTTTASVRGLAAVPAIPEDKLLPGTVDYLTALTNKGGEWLLSSDSISHVPMASMDLYLGRRQLGSHDTLLDADPKAVLVTKADLPQLANYAVTGKPRNPVRAARSHLLLAIQHRLAGHLNDDKALVAAEQAVKHATGIDTLMMVRASFELAAVHRARGDAATASEIRDRAESASESLGFRHLLRA
ncbi:MAG: hypothetical protein K1X57_22400 [Gemmataceae bacterium]|nr:hypothetical protein [Gemmataceae bacterium]